MYIRMDHISSKGTIIETHWTAVKLKLTAWTAVKLSEEMAVSFCKLAKKLSALSLKQTTLGLCLDTAIVS